MQSKLCSYILFLFILVLPVSAFAANTQFKLPIHLKWVTKLKKEKVVTRRPYQFATPVVNDGRIYVGSTSGYFYALTAGRGQKIWKRELASSIYSEPAIEGDTIFIADRKGIVYSIERQAGRIIWQTGTGGEISSRPVVEADTIYVVTVAKQIIALDRENGGRKWQTPKEGILPSMTIKGSSSPILYDGNLYVGFADGTLVSFNLKNGAPIWVRQLSGRGSQFLDVDATPLIHEGVIYTTTTDGHTYAINASNGGIIWKLDRGGPNDPAIDGGRIFITGGGVLTCADIKTGNAVWEHDFKEAEISAPVVKDGLVVAASTKDKLYIVDGETGELKHQRYIRGGAFGRPVIEGDTIYILSNSSRLFALEGS